jgi:hypothetical protein
VTPEIAEALVMRRVIIFARDEGFSNIIVSSDCLSVVQRVIAGEEDRSLYGPVIHDHQKDGGFFFFCSFNHDKRGLNCVAHSLAKLSEFFVCSLCHGVAPDCIREILCNDIIIL